jgi:hypothetical protein
LHGAEVALRVEQVHQGCAAMLIGVSHGVAHTAGLVIVLGFVGLEQDDVAFDLGVGGVDVAEDLLAGGLRQLAGAAYIDLRALFLALVAIEEAQGYREAEAERLVGIGIVEGRIVGVPGGESGVGRSVGLGKFVVGGGLLLSLEGGAEVGTSVESGFADVFKRDELIDEVEGAVDVELLDGGVVVKELEELNLGGAEVDEGVLDLGLVLDAEEFDAVEVDLGDVAGVEAVTADLNDVIVLAWSVCTKAERRVNSRVRSRSACCDWAICVPCCAAFKRYSRLWSRS